MPVNDMFILYHQNDGYGTSLENQLVSKNWLMR